MTGQTHPIAVMDGTCALCAFVARMVHRLDRPGDIRIAPIQGATGAALMRDYGFEPLDLDSWLFIDEYCTATRDLDSLIRLGQRTGGISWLLLCFKVFPKPSRNRIYACAVRNRYAMFGRADMCDIPNEAFRVRLLFRRSWWSAEPGLLRVPVVCFILRCSLVTLSQEHSFIK